MEMLTLLRTLSLGYLARHLTRSALVVLSIALGVGMLVATQSLSRSLKHGVEVGVNPLAGLADLLIVNGDTGVPAELAKQLVEERIPGVRSVTPFVLTRMSVADLNNKMVWLLGVEWPKAKDRATPPGDDNLLGVTIHQTYHPKTLTDKLGLLLAPPALVSENLSKEMDEANPKSRRFRLRTAGRTPEVTRLGTVTFAASGLPLKDSAVVVMDLLAASTICFPEKPGHIHQIGVSVAEGEPIDSVRDRVKEWLGARGDVRSVGESKEMVSDITAGLEIGIAIGGAGALVVGMFLVYNVLSVSVAERRHDIGILRSVGATRFQIAGLFVSEAVLMGLAGSGLGLPLGWGLCQLMLTPLATTISELMVPIDKPLLLLPPWLLAAAVVAGTLVAVLAALVPALHAAGEEPADAVRRVPRRHAALLVALQVAASISFLLAGFAFARFRDQLPLRAGMFAGIVCLVVGGLVATPILAALVSRFAQPLFRYLLGLEGRLAADNLVRTPGRTGIVIAALAATGGLMVQTAGFLKSTREAIHDWVEEKIAADLFVSAGSPVTSGGSSVTMPEELEEKLKKVPGVETVLPVRYLQIDYLNPKTGLSHIVWLVAVDSRAFAERGGDRPLARNLRSHPRMREKGTVVVSENFAALYGTKVGDVIQIPGKGETLSVEVVGTVTDYTWNRGTIILDRAWFREKYQDQQVSIYDLFLEPGANPEQVHAEVMDRYGAQYDLFILNRPEIHADVHTTLDRVYSLAYAQQAVVGLVALLGVVSALFISVLQRRRELGLLRAVGASRAQVLRSVLAEAVLMGLVGGVVGFGIGLLLEWYVLDILILDESGFAFPLRVPWVEAGVVSVASVVFATLAGLWPAYLATRLRITEAIAYE
jgi:putative ABC transport system permease protein